MPNVIVPVKTSATVTSVLTSTGQPMSWVQNPNVTTGKRVQITKQGENELGQAIVNFYAEGLSDSSVYYNDGISFNGFADLTTATIASIKAIVKY